MLDLYKLEKEYDGQRDRERDKERVRQREREREREGDSERLLHPHKVEHGTHHPLR